MAFSAQDLTTNEPLHVQSLIVRTGRLECLVHIDVLHRYSTPELAQALCEMYPDLPKHICINEKGSLFGAVMHETSLAHVLEHLTISIQAHQTQRDKASYRGVTEWIDEEQGIARIQVSFSDDIECLRAFNEALKVLNEAVITYLV